ncbi:MAG TPA: ThuA domain-containing protein [Flavitalea sp.]|nr:ThuA domain-containing protein [Flavitalea sp.]
MKRNYRFAFCLLIITLLQTMLYSCAQTGNKINSRNPLIVFVTGDHEYSGETTLPYIAAELEKNYGFRTKFLKASPDQNAEENIPGLEALQEADVAVFFLRWRRLPAEQVKLIEDYLKTGKPVVGFRTTTHAFNYPKGHELEKWNAFGELAFNSPPGWGGKSNHTHYGHNSSTDVTIIPEAAKNPILTGVSNNFHSRSWLYKVQPDYPSKGSSWLLMGHSINPEKTDAIDNPVAWTGVNSYGGKFFMTTLGHPEDFSLEPFQRLVINSIHWASGKKIPQKWAGKIEINVPYRGIVK